MKSMAEKIKFNPLNLLKFDLFFYQFNSSQFNLFQFFENKIDMQFKLTRKILSNLF